MSDDWLGLAEPYRGLRGHYELAFVKANGTADVWCYGFQPDTQTIAYRAKGYVIAVQKIGNVFEAYDLSTITVKMGVTSIGLPIATHENFDACMMMAVMA